MFPRRRAALILALAVSLALLTAPADGAQPPSARPHVGPIGLRGHWRIAFDDEFGGRHLNHRLWSTGWFGHGITAGPSNLEQECDDPRQVHVHDGLRITAVARAETCGGHQQRYASGLIETDGKFSFTYGAIQARIWMPGHGTRIADWPAFWADGQHWPKDGEIDVVEGLDGSPCWHFHYSGGGPGGCTSVRGAASGWHTYAADWERGSIAYLYDGRVVGRQRTGVTSKPMYLIVNLALSRAISPPNRVPETLRVAYVRVYKHAGH